MILVNSSVWIDFFNQAPTPQRLQLVRWLEGGDVSIGTADQAAFKVLHGFRNDTARRTAESLLLDLPVTDIGGAANALSAATLYRRLRAQGRTVRSPIDVLLASYCMMHGHTLLHRDADFESLKTLGGLDTWPQ